MRLFSPSRGRGIGLRLRAGWRHFDRPGDFRDFLCLGAALALARPALFAFGLRPLLVRLDRIPVRTGETPDEDRRHAVLLARGQRLARYADFWLRGTRARTPCLRRSLVLFSRLRREGLPVTFCLGIHADSPLAGGEPVTGHAWLELEDRAILEPEAAVARCVRTFRYPPPEAT